jgi:hypothetical protein
VKIVGGEGAEAMPFREVTTRTGHRAGGGGLTESRRNRANRAYSGRQNVRRVKLGDLLTVATCAKPELKPSDVFIVPQSVFLTDFPDRNYP